MTTENPSPAGLSVREIRRRWKPTKEQLVAEDAAEPLRIRIHRACSWMERVEGIDPEAALDSAIIFRWIALNGLYAIWDDDAGAPASEREALESFLDLVADIDRDGVLPAALEAQRPLVMSILEDEYLNRVFWENPSIERARRRSRPRLDAPGWYQQRQYRLILERVIERVYFLRCQLVHGGATLGGQLNRTAVQRCATLLGHLLPAFLVVIIDHGAREDWGPLCYPPVRDGQAGGLEH